MSAVDKAAQMAALPVRGDEDPFVVATGGFYRRWFNRVDDIAPMLETVKVLSSTGQTRFPHAPESVVACG